MTTNKPITDQQHKEIDNAMSKERKQCKNRQFVRGYRNRSGDYVIGRFTPVKGERKPRLLSWSIIKLS